MRLTRAVALSAIACWVGIASAPALAQGFGSLVVTITSPRSGSTVSGSTTVAASVTVIGSGTVAGVQFKLDGANLGGEDTSAPYEVSWDTTATGNGSHTLTAAARDDRGLRWTSDPVTVTVSNNPPTITSFTPAAGPVGTSVTISGTNFTGATAVRFNGVTASFTVNSATSIQAIVPAGATSGPISVTTPGGTATSASAFTVTASAPTITSFTPASGPVGTSVTISGTNFTGATAVRFNGVTASFTVNSATSIQATVPAGATSGPISVTTPGGTATSASAFTVTASAPTITSFTPASGPVGTSVTISGTNFTGATAVRFNGVTASFTVNSATSIQATVPAGATSGPISVTTPGGTATSASAFTVTAEDTTPPTVSIDFPRDGSTVSGTMNISATASDNVGVRGVEFRIDATSAVEDTVAPYAVSWNTTIASNGSHTLTAIARDAAGNRTTSAPVTVTVANDNSPLECTVPLDTFPGSTLFNNTVRAQMWIIDNTWWGVFSDNSTGIYFYKLQGSTFIKGDFIDPSFAAGKPDTLWNGSELFVLVEQSSSLAKLYKYSYLPATGSFVLVTGFPVDLPLSGSVIPAVANAVALAQDSTGKLWATYGHQRAGDLVHVGRSSHLGHDRLHSRPGHLQFDDRSSGHHAFRRRQDWRGVGQSKPAGICLPVPPRR
jgi:hypothetical protein